MVERLMRVGGGRARVVRVYRRTAGTHRWFGQHPNRVRRIQATGCEFLGTPFRQRLAVSGVQQSMTRGGAPGENAHVESFFRSIKAELIHGRSFATVAELRHELRRYVQYYNHQRLHSSLGYQSPVDYERRAA